MSTHYDILEIERNATPEEIRRAYKRLSLKYHPDRNPAANAHSKMQDINKAFEVLSDANRRAEYDIMIGVGPRAEEFQRSFFHFGGGGGGVDEDGFPDVNNIFNMIFQTHSFHSNPHMFHRMNKPPPIVVNINIPLSKAYSGGEHIIDIEKKHVNTTSNEVNIVKESLVVPIPLAIRDNTIIHLENRGNQVNEIRGDVKIIVHVMKDAIFERMEGLDLLIVREISLKESLCGFMLEFTHLNGKTYKISQYHSVINPHSRLCFERLGMRDEHGNIGRLHVHFKIRFPSELSEETKKLLEDIL